MTKKDPNWNLSDAGDIQWRRFDGDPGWGSTGDAGSGDAGWGVVPDSRWD
ncbi:hypothetical protein [Streptomyces sp. NPDC054863]